MAESNKRLFGIVGHPLGHSLSPILHEFILNKIHVKACYHAFEIKKEELAATIQSMKTLGFTGFNVTIPYKENIVSFLDEIDEEASMIGAVNTVLIKDNKLYGTNTDGVGFIQALKNKNMDMNGKSAVLLGAGGAARAVAYSLVANGIKKLWLLNRTPVRAELLANGIVSNVGFSNISYDSLSDAYFEQAVESSQIVINATSLGMWPAVETTPICVENFSPGLIVVDLVYNPHETKFLKAAKSAGSKIIEGLDMLIYQGVEAMKIWTAMDIRVENFFDEIRSKLIQSLKHYGKRQNINCR
ncbi:MAG: shikimate dehydrogenase [bacterium]